MHAPPPPATGRHAELLYALNRVAASIQQSARSEEAVFRAFQEQAGGLGLRGGINLLDETGDRLLTRNVVFPEAILPKLEEFIGLKDGHFAFALSRVDIYRQVVETGEAIFLSDSRTVLTQFFPKPMQPVADRIAKLLGTPPLIVTPLKAGGQVRGTLSIAGDDLTAEDLPAVEAFAHHISVALENARLFAALHESEEKYRLLVENANESIVVAQDGIIKFANPRVRQIVGFSKEEMESRPFLDFVHPDDRAVMKERYEKRLRGDPLPEVHTFQVIDKSGDVHWVEARGASIVWQGRPASLTVLTDITERKRAEQLLQTLILAAQAMEQALTPEEIFSALTEELGKLDFSCMILPVDEDESTLYPQYLGYESKALRFAEGLVGIRHEDFGLPVDSVEDFVQVVRQRKTIFQPNAEDTLRKVLPKGVRRFTRQIATVLQVPKAIAAPLVVEDKVIGLLSVQSNDLTETDVPTITVFAHQVAAVWRKAELYQQARQEALDRTQAEKRFRSIVESSPMGMHMYELMPDGRLVFSGANPAADKILGVDNSQFIGKTIEEAFPPLMETEVPERYRLAAAQGESWQTEQITYQNNQIAGAFEVHAFQTSPGKMVALFNEITERKRAEDAVLRSERQRAQLLEVAGWIQSTLKLDEVVRRIFESLHEVLSYDMCGIYWVDWEAKLLRPYMILGPDQWSKPLDMWPIPLGQGITGTVAKAGQAECINNAHLDPRAIYPPGAGVFRDHLISIPVQTQDRTSAVFNISRHDVPPFTPEEFDLAQLFVAQASAAIENARLFEAAQQRAAQLAALNRVASTASASLDLDHILQTAVDTILDVIGMESGGVSFWDERQNVMEVAVAQNVPPAIEASYNGPLRPHGLRHHILTSEQAVFMDDFAADERATPLAHSQGFHSAALVPLRSRDKVLGLLVIGGQSSHTWTPDEKELLTNIADQLAMAIENARLYEETRKQAEQVQQILDTAPEGIILLDMDYRIELANPTAWQVMPLLAGGTATGDSLTRLGDRPIAELLVTDPEGMPHEITIPGSPPRIFELAANPLKVEGQAGGWVLLCREVTEERAVQERIQQHERLAAVGQLAAGIAHDFNNLLQGIIGFSDLLQRRPDQDDTTRRGLAVINTQGQRAAKLIRQILDFSRRTVVDRHPFDLLSLAKETTKLLERTLPENINILTECHGHSFMVNADVAQLQQVITNLAVNARDAMPEGGTLRFKLSRLTFKHDAPRPFPEMPAGQWVSLAVSDSGTGMPEEVLSHIFEPFFTTKEIGQGSGLGLAQVYGIVRQHDGYIGADSKPGHGTTFTIYLPEWVEGAGVEPSPEHAGLTSGRSELILLVDDNAMVREVGEAMLANLGYQVVTAQNGLDALAIYEQRHHEIALILSDMVMPAMGGTELAQRLQEIDPQTKVVLMSGYPLGETGGERSGAGVAAWIQKPLSLDRLAEVVGTIVQQQS